jgi:predicted nucleic acid-binding Zn ribbon protein
MVSNAIQRVLSREMDRVVIGSLADLKRAYENELAGHHAEIATEVEHVLAISRDVSQRIRTKFIHERRECEACGGPIESARRMSRWFCSDRCRQRAYRQRRQAEAP